MELSETKKVIGGTVNSSLANDSVNQEREENSGSLNNGAVLEMVIVIKPDAEEKGCVGGENRDLIHPDMVSKVLEDEVKGKGLDDDKQSSSCVEPAESLDVESICRICHLSSDQALETNSNTTSNDRELIQLGCGCKDDLGIAHSYCAEAWFKLKGNRLCEICGETAKNITGVADNRFMEEWNNRILSGYSVHSAERSGGCWRGQPFCNFLMACLVIAFVLPWFFRVNMF